MNLFKKSIFLSLIICASLIKAADKQKNIISITQGSFRTLEHVKNPHKIIPFFCLKKTTENGYKRIRNKSLFPKIYGYQEVGHPEQTTDVQIPALAFRDFRADLWVGVKIVNKRKKTVEYRVKAGTLE